MAQRSELAPGIFVLQERLEQPTRIKYDVANESDARLDMAIDLSGSENVACVPFPAVLAAVCYPSLSTLPPTSAEALRRGV